MQPIYLFPDALTETDVESLRSAAESRGFQATGVSYPPSYRDNDRAVVDDEDLAGWLFARIECHLPATMSDGDGQNWQLCGLNRRIRFCRYRNGQSFRIHRDGVHHESDGLRSLLTFMVYLNDAAEFTGGATRFYRGRDRESGKFLTVAPRRGLLIVFDHGLWHDGAPVPRGTKWVMRSDVMYRRAGQAAGAHTGHLGYVWQVVPLADGRLASCGRDGTLRLWARPGAGDHVPVQTAVTRANGGSLTALVETPGGALWIGDRAGGIRIWRDGAWVTRRIGHDGAILALARLPDGRIASASADGTIGLWSESGQVEHRLAGHDGWVWSLAARSDGVLFSGGEDGTARGWSLASATEVTRLTAPAPVRALLSTRAWDLWAGCADGTVIGWRGDRERARTRAHSSAIRALAELPDGRLASAGEDDCVRVFATGSLTELACRRHDDFVTSVVALPDGRLVSGSYDGALRIWPDNGSRPDAELTVRGGHFLDGHAQRRGA